MKHFGISFSGAGKRSGRRLVILVPEFQDLFPEQLSRWWWTVVNANKKKTIQLVMAVAVNIEHPSESEKNEPTSESEMLNSSTSIKPL